MVTDNDARVTFYHAPNSRSGGTFLLLEELGVDYDLHLLNLDAEEQRREDYLAVNPMGKVPAIVHNGVLVTEQPAVMMYLADLYPEAGLAPPLGDPRRGAYLRWMVFYGSCFEPAVTDRVQQHEPAAQRMSPYGTFDEVLDTVTQQLEQHRYILGDEFSAADVLWATALNWTLHFGVLPERPPILAYVERVNARPAMRRGAEKNAALAAEQDQDEAGQ